MVSSPWSVELPPESPSLSFWAADLRLAASVRSLRRIVEL